MCDRRARILFEGCRRKPVFVFNLRRRKAFTYKFIPLIIAAFAPLSRSADLKEPLTLRSENGVLNILMVARAAPISSFPSVKSVGQVPTGWVYEICKRP